MGAISAIRRLVSGIEQIRSETQATKEGIINQADLLNRKLSEIIGNLVNEQKLLNDKLDKLIRVVAEMPRQPASVPRQPESGLIGKPGLQQALKTMPLERAPKTFNTDHPDYDPALVRNFPGQLFQADRPSTNPVLQAMRGLMKDGEIADSVWDEQLQGALTELRDSPGAQQLFERKEEAERYFADINRRYDAHYQPGWVNIDDALFLYWLIRRARPHTIVETGVCNGFSAGVTILALAKNDDDGGLHAVGRAEIFDPNDPKWTEKDRVFGEVVVGGQTLGWMIPNAYQHWAELYEGNAEDLLPRVVDRLDSIDLFFHDSDHSYDHMMFEFREAKRKLSPGGIIIADNIAWNSSLWDFAEEHQVPAYNFRGSLGVAFF